MIGNEVITMKCPNCGVVYGDHCRFCGAPLLSEKKGSHGVPILLMLFLTIAGLCVFFATSAVASLAPQEPAQPFLYHNGSVYAAPDAFLSDEEVTVPASIDGQPVTAIGSYGFAGTEYMTTITLPDTLEVIGEGAFLNCFSLRSIDLPESVTIIGPFVFNGCQSLEAIHIPASVSHIGIEALHDCYNLTHVFYDGTMDEWEVLYFSRERVSFEVHCSDGTIYPSE